MVTFQLNWKSKEFADNRTNGVNKSRVIFEVCFLFPELVVKGLLSKDIQTCSIRAGKYDSGEISMFSYFCFVG